MVRPIGRVSVLGVAALMLVAAAVTGYLVTRAGEPDRAATTVRIDGTDHPCGPRGRVAVGMTVTGPRDDARFAIDGVEVPSRRMSASPVGPVTSYLLPPEPLQLLRCDDGIAHRFTALTDATNRCSWSVVSEQSLDDARVGRYDLTASGTGCTLTIVD